MLNIFTHLLSSRRESLLKSERCMKQSDTEHKSVSGAVDSNGANTRLTGSWLIFTRVVWLVLVIPSLGLFVASLLVSYQQMQTVCVDPVMCNLTGALTAQELQALASSGFTLKWVCHSAHHLFRDHCSDLVRGRLPHFLAQV